MHKELPDDVAASVAADFGARFERVARSFDQQANIVTETIEKLESAIASALTHKANTPKDAAVASDIRQFVRSMPDGKRMDWMHDRIKDGDVENISAVLASPWVAGLDRQQAETVRDLASQCLAPVEYSQRDAARKLSAHLQSASQIFVERYQRMLPKVRPDSVTAASKKLREG